MLSVCDIIEGMKKCSNCKQYKPLNQFNKNKSRGDGLHTECKDCKKKRKDLYYKNNKEKFLGYAARKRRKIKSAINDLKNKPCLDCRQSFPSYVMQFHHRNPDEKEFDVARAVGSSLSLERILKEIEKCDLLCANCHAIRSYGAS